MSQNDNDDGLLRLVGIAAIFGFILLVVGLIPSTTTYVAPEISATSTSVIIEVATTTPEVLEQPIEPLKAISYPLKHVCACESAGNAYAEPRHYNTDGSVLRGRINPRDVGICQINLDYHEAAATRMGLDLMSRNDNITYAEHLYATQGLTPWAWSQACWGQAVNY